MFFWLPKNPNVAKMLVPWFVPADKSVKEIFIELFLRLSCRPEDTFVCIAVENDRIKGVVAAYCRDVDVWVWQVRFEGMSRRTANRIFEGLCHWARGKGFDKIAGGPSGSVGAWERRWGAKQQSNSKELVKEI